MTFHVKECRISVMGMRVYHSLSIMVYETGNTNVGFFFLFKELSMLLRKCRWHSCNVIGIFQLQTYEQMPLVSSPTTPAHLRKCG